MRTLQLFATLTFGALMATSAPAQELNIKDPMGLCDAEILTKRELCVYRLGLLLVIKAGVEKEDILFDWSKVLWSSPAMMQHLIHHQERDSSIAWWEEYYTKRIPHAPYRQ
jgi:hypothetical protein